MAKIHAELGVLPIGTPTTSLSQYIAQGINNLDKIEGIRYMVTPMGTIIESDNIDKVFEAVKSITNSIFEMGIARIETILKIDERRDRNYSLEDKLKSINKDKQK